MQKDKPSRTAYKVAMNMLTLGAKPGMDKFLPPGIVQATEKLLVASGVVGSRTVRWARSKRMVSVYEAFDWMLPGQFEAFARRKAFFERQVRERIGEGLVMYLPLEAVRSLFCQCAVVTGNDTRIAFSYIPSGADGRPDTGRWTGLMLWLQKVAGEPLIWSIRPEELGPFLEETGWRNAPALAGTPRKHGVEFYAVATK